jgi:hypothetical protein
MLFKAEMIKIKRTRKFYGRREQRRDDGGEHRQYDRDPESKETGGLQPQQRFLDLDHLAFAEAALLIVGGILAIVYSKQSRCPESHLSGGWRLHDFRWSFEDYFELLADCRNESFEAEAKLRPKKPWPTIWLSVAALNWLLASPFAW